jgi:hypothetical protein
MKMYSVRVERRIVVSLDIEAHDEADAQALAKERIEMFLTRGGIANEIVGVDLLHEDADVWFAKFPRTRVSTKGAR